MMDTREIRKIDKKIKKLRIIAEDIMKQGGQIEAVKRNTKRILASIRMLELNISDLNH
jgi:hypothetical protein